jgi:hypothetical protein
MLHNEDQLSDSEDDGVAVIMGVKGFLMHKPKTNIINSIIPWDIRLVEIKDISTDIFTSESDQLQPIRKVIITNIRVVVY